MTLDSTIKKRVESFEIEDWIRTCQECGNIQKDKEPIVEMTDVYRNRKCKKCKSEALDFGTQNGYDEYMED